MTNADYDTARRTAGRFYREAITKMFAIQGIEPTKCKSCHRQIWFLTTKSGKSIPYTSDALPHFVDCPNAKQHRKSK